MNAIATTTMPLTYADIERLGASIAKSGLFGIRTPEQAVALMMIAQAEGRHPALAARDYDVIQGRPSKKSEAMARDFLEAGGKIEWHTLTDDKAEATFSHPAGGKARIGWDLARASKAGLAGKDNWKKFPRQMLRSRVVSEGVRTVWPMATSGLYVPEEVADFSGPTIEAEATKPEPDRREQINAEVKLQGTVPLEDQPKRMTWTQLLKSFELAIADAMTAEEIQLILRSPPMTEAKAHIGKARSEHQQKLDEIMVLADTKLRDLEATTPAEAGSEQSVADEGETLDIFGEEKVTAG